MVAREPNRRWAAASHQLRGIIPVRSKAAFDFLRPILRQVCAFAYGVYVHMQTAGRLDTAVLCTTPVLIPLPTLFPNPPLFMLSRSEPISSSRLRQGLEIRMLSGVGARA